MTKRKNKSKTKSKSGFKNNLKKCANIQCPTPDEYYNKDNLSYLEGQIFCVFCYTKFLAQNMEEKDQKITLTKTKHISEEKLNRIKSNNGFYSKIRGDGTSRIPSIENKEKEIDIWREIIQTLDISKKIDTGKINSVQKLIDEQGWIIKTSTVQLFIKLDLISNIGKDEKTEISSILSEIKYNYNRESLENLTMRSKKWIANKSGIQLTDINDYRLLVYQFEDSVISLEEFDFSSMEVKYLKEVVLKFGSYIYQSWFLGCLNPFDVLLLQKIDSSVEFIPFSKIGLPFKHVFIDSTYMNIAIKLPIVLEYIDDFYKGCKIEKEKIIHFLKEDHFTTLIKSYYFDENTDFSVIDNFLADIPPFYEQN